MRTDDLDFELPPDLVAERPAEPRDACRLLRIERTQGGVSHARFSDLGSFLRPGDLLVLNSARVVPARIRARHVVGDTPAELLLLDAGAGSVCEALANSRRRLAPGGRLMTEGGVAVRLGDRVSGGRWQVFIEGVAGGWNAVVAREGHMPLPPYILKRRATGSDVPEDREWYQTTFADRAGAVAAPTAGLHFTGSMLSDLASRGIGIARIFLRVGPGTFLPVRADRVEDHRLLPEEFEIGTEAAEMVCRTRAGGGRVVAVGTTVVRALEHCAREHGQVVAASGATDLLVSPPFEFRVVDGLLTNFHLPRSTLVALVYAFGGAAEVRAAYSEAVRERYRFYSYGDAMLIL